MKLITKKLKETMPKLYATENTPCDDKIAMVRYFIPGTTAQWFGIEYSEEENLMFGFASLFADPIMDEYGYFSLDELLGIRGPFGMQVERDLHFTPMKMGDIIADLYKDEER